MNSCILSWFAAGMLLSGSVLLVSAAELAPQFGGHPHAKLIRRRPCRK
jgi:hypothetical protein